MTAPVEAGDLPRLHLVAMLAAALANAGLTLTPRESAEVASDLVCRGESKDGSPVAFWVTLCARAERELRGNGANAEARSARAAGAILATLDPAPRRVGEVGDAPEAT